MKRSQQLKVALIVAGVGLVAFAFLWRAAIEPRFFVRNFTASLWADLHSLPLTINMRSNVPGMKPLLAFISIVTGIPLGDIQALPFGAAARAVLYFAIVREVAGRVDIAAVIALVTLIYPWAAWGYQSVFVHSLGGFLFLAFVLLILMMARSAWSPAYPVTAFGLFVALYLVDYTPSAWAMGMIAALIGVAHYRHSLNAASMTIYLLIAGTLYSFKSTIGTFVVMWQDEHPVAVVLGYFISGPADTVAYEYTPEGARGLGLSIYVYVLITLALGIYGLSLGWVAVREQSISAPLSRISTQEYIIGTALVGGGFGTALYTLMGRFTQFFIFLMGPLIGLLAAWHAPQYLPAIREHRAVIATIFAIFLLSIVGAEFGYQAHNGDIDRGSAASGETAGEWLATYTSESTVQSGLTTAGQMRLPEEQHNAQFEWVLYDEKGYIAVVERGEPHAEYIVIDFESERGVQTIGEWTSFEPLGQYEERVDSNTHMNRIYHGGVHSTYQSQNATGQQPSDSQG